MDSKKTSPSAISWKLIAAACLTVAVLVGIGLFFFEAFGTPGTPSDQVYTQQAMTLQAVLTDAQLPNGTTAQVDSNTAVPAGATPITPADTAAALPTNTLLPSLTGSLLPSITQTPLPCFRAEFISETIPDNSKYNAGDSFTKSWKVRNTGSCSWTPDFKLALYKGERMGGKDQSLDITIPVGSTQDLYVALTAPTTLGSHRGDWMLKNPQGLWFGIGPNGDGSIYVQIQVISTTPTDTLTPTGPTDTPTETPIPPTSTPTRTPTSTPTPPGPTRTSTNTPTCTPTAYPKPC